MKKFLTVLLALSVVFTYSFSAVGTAFADVADKDQEANIVAAEKTALVEAEANLNKALSELSGVAQEGYVIEAAAWEQVKAEIWAAVKGKIEAATDAQLENYTATTTDGADYTGDALVKAVYYNGDDCKIGVADLKKLAVDDFGVKAALAQFNIDYAEELAKFDNVDMSLYSTTVVEPTSDKTYAELAQQYIQEAKEEIASYLEDEAKVNEATSVAAIASILGGVQARVTAGAANDARFPYLVMTKVGTTDIDSGLYKLNPNATLYTTLKIKTNTELENEGIISNANAAAVKAKVQQMYANYLTGVANPDLTLAKNYVTVYSWLADAGVITNPATIDTAIKDLTNTAAINKAVEDVETLNAFAKKYLAETDADGAAVRDEATINEIVKEATTDLYALAAKVKTTADTTYDTLNDALAAIATAIIDNDAYKLDFEKKAQKAALESAREEALVDYYPLEQKAVNAAFDAAIAKVDVSKTVTAAKNAAVVDLSKIKDKDAVNALFADIDGNAATGATLYAPAHAQYEKAVAYLAYKNKNLNVRDAAYIDGSGLADAMVEFYGENGARTKAEIEALADKIESIVDALPTIGGLAAAKAAAETAINAIPATVTAADKGTVEAAWEAAEAYAAMMNATNYSDLVVDISNKAKLTSAISDLHSAMALDLAKKATAVDKTDKAALKAVQAEIDAFNALCEAGELFAGKKIYNDTAVQDALDAIRNKELKAVQDAIFALPINITEADQAAIENTRALYDAYVDEYTSYDPRYDAVAAIGYDRLRALTVAETRLANILADKKIKAVEALKITAGSSAVKGAITVKWSVKGDAEAADGYQIYRSVKKNSGFGTTPIFTTTKLTYKNTKSLKKGTRYYYKVRAYAEIDGVKYYSDWSNKAYRIAK